MDDLIVRREANSRIVLANITEFLVKRDVPRSEVVREASWSGDIGVDSLDVMTLIQELDDDFGVRITAVDAPRLRTVGEVADFVAERYQAEAHQAELHQGGLQ